MFKLPLFRPSWKSPKPDRRYLIDNYPDKIRKKSHTKLWLLVAAIATSLVAISLHQAEAAEPIQLWQEDHSGTMKLANEQGQQMDALLLRTSIKIKISGMLASVTYSQSYRNNSSDWLEGRYSFPLPETAAVHALTMKVGERVMKGEIKEKRQAQKIYRAAKQAGKRASLVEQQRPNLFTQRIANIGPDETIEVVLGYRHKVDYSRGVFELQLPLTITPRYIPGAPIKNNENIHINTSGWGWATPTDQVPDADWITPLMSANPLSLNRNKTANVRNPVSLEIELAAGLPLATINTPYHAIDIQKQGTLHHISFSKNFEPMDRDFTLRWQPVAEQAPTAALFQETLGDENYLMLMLMPPKQQSSAQLPRDIQFIIDTSGSMAGTSIEQAKQSLQLALTTLKPSDRFNVVQFNSNYSKLAPTSLPATEHNIYQAQTFVASLNAGGGTEMYAPLKSSLTDENDEKYLKQIIFITDGSVGNESALFNLIEKKLGTARLFTVAIGSAPNHYFMRKAAQFGRGTFTHIGSSTEVNKKMSALFQQLQAPQLRDIKIEWPDNLEVDSFPQKIPDLYRGQPLLLTAKIKGSLQGSLALSGKMAKKLWQQKISLRNSADSIGVAALWGREKIAALMDSKHRGTSEAEIKPKVLSIALTHQLLSAYTSFIAVDQTPARAPSAPLKIQQTPNLVAQGQVGMRHTYPQGALNLHGNVLLGFGALLSLLLLRLGRKVLGVKV